MCGGSGPSGKTEFEWNDDLKPYWRRNLAEGEALSKQPYQAYGGQRIAGINEDQETAMEGIRHFARSGGNDATIAANGQAYKTLSGDYLNGNDRNPYSDMLNPWREHSATVGANEFMGDSPMYRDMLKNDMADMTDAYKQGTSADTARMFAMSGAFGGSAHQNAVANNEGALAKQLTQYGRQMGNDQYNRSAGLRESDIGRRLQNDQFDKNLGGQWDNDTINRGYGAFEGERGRQMGAIGAGQAEQGLSLQRLNAMMGVGDINRGFTQDNLNMNYGNWQEQQNHPFKQLDWLTGLLSRSQGGMSPNSTTSQSGYSASPFSMITGAGLLGKGMGMF